MAGPSSSSLVSDESRSIANAYISNMNQFISLMDMEDQNKNDLLSLIDVVEDVRCRLNAAEEERDFYKKRCEETEEERDFYKKRCEETEDERESYKKRCEELEANIRSPTLATIKEDDDVENHFDMESRMEEVFEPYDSTPVSHVRYRVRRSMSIPMLNKSRESTTSEDGISTSKKPSPPVTPSCSNTYVNKIENRVHDFDCRRVFTKMICYVCGANIRFGSEAVKCQNCKSICHQHCRNKAPIPCIPWFSPPKVTNGRLRLSEYCSDHVIPRIPHLIVRCVQYLNAEKLEKNIYTINDSIQPDAELLLKLLLNDRNPPAFASYGPQAVAACVLKFLTNLRESLILETSLRELLKAAEQPDDFDLDTVIADLPIIHKNTLAYLFIHWKILNGHSNVNGLTAEVLARAIVPVIMRISVDNLPIYVPTFVRLLSFPISYWENVIDDSVKFFTKTPLSRNSSKKSKAEISYAISVAKVHQAASIRRNGF